MPDAPPRFRPQNAPQRTTPTARTRHAERAAVGRRDGRRRACRRGTSRRLLVACCVLLAAAPGLAADGEPAARFLILALDAVPYEVALELSRDDGYPTLAAMRGPVPLVSSFPSSTSVALTAILAPFGLELPPGYENRFFDREAGRVRGGTLASYGKIRFDWHHFFDWQLRGFLRKSKAYAKPLKYNLREVDRALEAFEASDQKAFFAYVNSTDATGHSHGPAALERTFANLDARLAGLRRRLEAPLHVVLFSDHGLGGDRGAKLRNAYPNVRRALRAAGFRTRKRLDGERRVVLTPFGLVSSFEAYTRQGEESEVAETLVVAEGVDLCAFRVSDDRWVVLDREGRAEIERRPLGDGTAQWAYRPERGDPLDYREASARLGDGANDFHAGERWFDATLDETYPDALYRIATGFELVENPASILCSVADGYLFGSRSAAFAARFSVGRLRWTHGALARDASMGFLMTDYPGWTPEGAIRFDEALDFLAERLEGAAR